MELSLISAATVTNHESSEIPREHARMLRRADSITRMAVRATSLCLSELKVQALPDISRLAVCVGLGMGTLETNLAFVDSLFSSPEMQGSPTLFSHSVHNTVAGYITRIFGTRGPAMTVTDFAWPFLSALQEAWCLIRAGRVPAAIVTGSEDACDFLVEAYRSISGEDAPRWQGGAVSWLVAAPEMVGSSPVLLKEFSLDTSPCRSEELLLRLSENYPAQGDNSNVPPRMPHGYLLSLGRTARHVLHEREDFCWNVTADFGSARLVFHTG